MGSNSRAGLGTAEEESTAMKKLALAVSVLAATALTSAAAVPAAGDTQVHTKRFVSRTIETNSLGTRHLEAGTAVDRHAGRVIGYDSFSSHIHPQQNRIDVWDSFALKNGTIAVVFHLKLDGTLDVGRILHGTGTYAGIQGTVIERPVPNKPKAESVTLTYHF
jgi:hypothetical protein